MAFLKWNIPVLAAYFDNSAVYLKTFWQPWLTLSICKCFSFLQLYSMDKVWTPDRWHPVMCCRNTRNYLTVPISSILLCKYKRSRQGKFFCTSLVLLHIRWTVLLLLWTIILIYVKINFVLGSRRVLPWYTVCDVCMVHTFQTSQDDLKNSISVSGTGCLEEKIWVLPSQWESNLWYSGY